MPKKMTQMVIGAVVVVVLAVGGFMILHHSNTAAPPSSTTSSSGSTANTTSIVQTKSAASVGSYLADANGNALYTYGADSQGVSNCSGSCLYSWPIYSAISAPSTLPANVTVITRSDGQEQYAYKGLPLYTFSADSAGQVTGDGVSGFHVAKP